MFKVFLCLLIGGIVALANAKATTGPRPPTKPDDNFSGGGLYPNFVNPIFDIKFTEKQLRSGIGGENYRWRNGLYVHPDRGFNANEYNVLNAALYDLSQILCIQVLVWPQESQPTGDYTQKNRREKRKGNR